MPFQRALLELAYGQVLRRAGQRRAAAHQLQAARDRLAGLQARPYLERCERELAACGLAPAKRSDFDPSRLTAQESAVARLVALGMGNRQVASELFVSIKTVQFHLTHIYAKLGISTRAELAAQFRDTDTTDRTPPRARPGQDEDGQPHLERPDPQSAGSRSHIAKRSDVDRPRLTPQESAVARLVAARDGQPTSRLRTLRQHQDRPIPPHPHLRQTRHQHPRRTRRPTPRHRHHRSHNASAATPGGTGPKETANAERCEGTLGNLRIVRRNTSELPAPAASPGRNWRSRDWSRWAWPTGR